MKTEEAGKGEVGEIATFHPPCLQEGRGAPPPYHVSLELKRPVIVWPGPLAQVRGRVTRAGQVRLPTGTLNQQWTESVSFPFSFPTLVFRVLNDSSYLG